MILGLGAMEMAKPNLKLKIGNSKKNVGEYQK